MPSEKKENCSMIPRVGDIHIRQIPSRIRWPGIEGSECLMLRVSLQEKKKILELNGGEILQQCECS